ncbi:MAG: PIN domain-containing protein [Chloroflexi bacterium]|nr:PIN domain-containing protein [Chloroflexota bacterium]
MNLVCFDNNILIWGIKGQATPGQEEMIYRARAFIRKLHNDHIRVLIPSVVIAEFLLPVPPEEHPGVLDLFHKRFLIASFDTAAASVFAKIWQAKKGKAIVDELAKKGNTKTEMRTDSMIVATACSQRADCIYSHDHDLRAFAKDYIEVREMPLIPDQTKWLPEAGTDNTDWGKLPKMNESP